MMILEWRKNKMINFQCEINYWLNDVNMHHEVITTIEDDIIVEPDKNNKDQDTEFETHQLTESLLLELLKEDYGDNVELINFEPIIDNNFDIYRLTY
jgi:hypothetical protein